MPSSWEKVCNLAMARLGEPFITNLSDNTKEAKACKNTYEMVVDEVLERHNWSFANEIVSIAPLSTTPVAKWEYEYLMPSSPYCLRVIKVQDSDENDIEYAISGRKIMCNQEDEIILHYTSRITDPTHLPPTLAMAIALRLAHWIEAKFGDSITRRKSIGDEYDAVILQAKINNQASDYSNDEYERSGDNIYGNSDWVTEGRS